MTSTRASIFGDEPLDLTDFAPAKAPDKTAPPAEAVRAISEKANFRRREASARAGEPNPTLNPIADARPARRLYRTGRSVQFNMKASREAIDRFIAICDAQHWVLGETLEHAVTALEEKLAGGREGGKT